MSESYYERYHNGMTCPKCDAPVIRVDGRNSVIDSRPGRGGIRRRRLCANCGTRFTTHEVVVCSNEEAGYDPIFMGA